jgi:hypothetical protein
MWRARHRGRGGRRTADSSCRGRWKAHLAVAAERRGEVVLEAANGGRGATILPEASGLETNDDEVGPTAGSEDGSCRDRQKRAEGFVSKEDVSERARRAGALDGKATAREADRRGRGPAPA